MKRIDALEEKVEKLEGIAQFLFSLLDDIDTWDDAARNDDKLFRDQARKLQERRFEVGTTDGYKVWWKAIDPTPAPEPPTSPLPDNPPAV